MIELEKQVLRRAPTDPNISSVHPPGTPPGFAGARPASRLGLSAGVAIAVVALVVLAALALPGGLIPPPSGTGASTPTTQRSPAALSTKSPTVSLSSAGAGACAAASTVGTPSASHSVAPAITPSLTGPSPLYNSQVEPYAVVTGPYGYVAAGAALRDQGYGRINLTWPGAPSTSNLVAAYMVWSILNNSVPPSYGTLNGVNVTGTWTAFATPSPCWAPTYIYTFVAGVTSIVANGVNNLTNFPSAVTSGADPWSETNGLSSEPMAEGVSLIAVYDSGSSSVQQVTVYTGAYTTEGGSLAAQLNYSTTDAKSAKTTYLVADGQLPGNIAVWNGTTIDSDAFPGSDPHESSAKWSYGNLSDTKTFNVNVTDGSNNTTAKTASTGGDCFTWIGQVLSVGVAASAGPYAVVFQEQGLPNGADWKVKTDGVTRSGTVVDQKSTIKFTLGNGTYNYSVTPIAGYIAPDTGTYHVAGGPVYLRVLFHEVVYSITFNETGLPTTAPYDGWWVELTNSSQGLSDNLSVYAPSGFLFEEGNGTYNFTTGDLGLYLPEPAKGTFRIVGASVTIPIAFRPPPLYNVTFLEQGLPSGTKWGGNLGTNWGAHSNQTTNRSFSLFLPNTTGDTDLIEPTTVTGFSAAGYLYFGVHAKAETVDVNYSKLFAVNLTETGLPSGTYWYASLVGGISTVYSESDTSTLPFSVVNGSYTFTVSPIWAYTARPSTGPVKVDGSNVTVPIVFTLSPTYTLRFNETGLRLGTSWSVMINLPNGTPKTGVSSGSFVSFSEPNGTYSFTVLSVPGYTATPSSSYAYVTGHDANESIAFVPVFAITFRESGLPSGTYWYVLLNDESYETSYSSTVVFLEENGTYSFDAYSFDGYTPSPTSGSVPVSGANVTRTINYTSVSNPTFAVTFTESGLPAHTNWSVDLNYYTEWSTGTTLNFTEANGSFDFEVGGAAGYTPNPSSSTIDVSGAAAHKTIVFTPSTGGFTVTFSESGLPSGLTWTVIVGGTPEHLTTDGGTDTLMWTGLASSTYPYSVTGSSGWHQTTLPYNGNVVVDGASVTEPTLVYAPVTYLVTFTESGLPNGAAWYANITGQTGLSETVLGSSGTSTSVDLANDSYSYTAATNDKSWATSAGGDFAVSGSPLSEPVPFSSTSATDYTVTFTESGLPNGATWYVNITGQSGLLETVSGSTGTQSTISLPNLEYDYAVSTNEKNWTTTPTGDFTVAGAALPVSVPFTLVSYLVTAAETGLPNGATWYFNITGQSALSATVSGSSGTSVSVDLQNGSYVFTASSNAKGWTTSAGGHFAVAGSPVNEPIPFTSTSAPQYEVTFTESGLSSGATWYVNITGQSGLSATVSGSSGTSVSIELPNGSYSYGAVTNLKNWTATSGSFSVSGSSKNVSVSFTTAGGSSGASSAAFPTLWVGVGAGVLVLLALLLFLFLARRRRKKEENPSQGSATAPSGPSSKNGP